MPFEPIQNFLPKIATKKNFGTTYKAIEVCQAFKHVIEQILPPDALNGIAPKSYKEGVLTVSTFNTVCAHIMHMQTHRIIALLNARLGITLIKKIKIVPEVALNLEPQTPGSFSSDYPDADII